MSTQHLSLHGPYTLSGLGPHDLEWRYVKDSSGDAGDDCGWVDKVEWTSTTEVEVGLQDSLDVGWPVVTAGDVDWANGCGADLDMVSPFVVLEPKAKLG